MLGRKMGSQASDPGPSAAMIPLGFRGQGWQKGQLWAVFLGA